MTVSGLLSLLIFLLVLATVFYVIDWIIGLFPVFGPMRSIIRILLALIELMILLQALGLLTYPLVLPRLK